VRARVRLRIALVRAGFALGRLLGRPRRRVVLATTHAPAINGNLACLRDDLARRHPSVPVSIVAYRPARTFRSRLVAAVQSLRAGFYLATAQVFIIDDYFMPMYTVRPREGTTYLQVWHASGAFKRFGYSVLDKSFGLSEESVARMPIHTNYDVCLVSSMRFAPAYAEAFRQPIEKFTARTGIPRTDVLFDAERTARVSAELRERYGLTGGRRVVLYAPTFRGDSVMKARAPEGLDLQRLHELVGDDVKILLRLHPFVRDAQPIAPALRDFVADASDYPDIHDLMLVSDVLVTDYSSSMYEFSLLGRPMAFFAPDHEEYENERGFFFDFKTGVPGPVFETTDELAAWLAAGEFDLERVARFRDESFEVADGRATERFVDEIVLPALR
jgi:teichoic acid ribitol-phosphate primase